MSKPQSKPLRVAIVGTGPAGMYALEQLLRESDINIEIDLFERLPSPWGLIRAGVAPDHPDKKQIINRLFSYSIYRDNVRFFGNVEIGKDISHQELAEWYNAVIYAVGANDDTRMNIPGEDLNGCWAAREFVAWYNGHPDFKDLQFDLSGKRAVIVGNGNVALDVARILTLPIDELAKTDIADHALQALSNSTIEEVVILGRRSHVQAAYHNAELEELEHLKDVEIRIEGDDFSHDKTEIADWQTRRKIETLQRLVTPSSKSSNKRIVFRFLSSPLELRGGDKLEQIRVGCNQLVRDDNGNFTAQPTGEQHEISTGLVLRAIGYRGEPLPDLPFNERKGVFKNLQGRVTDNGKALSGTYVTGWIKRGAKGIIGSNKRCAGETVSCLLQDYQAGKLSSSLNADAVFEHVQQRVQNLVDLKGWIKIDRHEKAQGLPFDRPRVKVTDTDSMLDIAQS